MTRQLAGWTNLAVWWFTLGLAGCSAGEVISAVDAGRGAGPVPDGATQSLDAAVAVPEDGNALPDTGVPPEYGSSGLEAADEACFDGLDNDGDGRSDCGDASCQANVPSCCVGTSSSICCLPSETVLLPYESCGADLGSCDAVTAAFDVFGTARPRVEVVGRDAAPTFLPGGQSDDGGVLFPGRLDPRTGSIRLRAQVASSVVPPIDALDALAVGLVDAQAEPATLSRVFPAVAFVISRNRQEVGLVIAGETVERWPLPDEAFHEYELVVSPDGTIRFTSDWATDPIDARAVLALDGSLRMAAYGRSANPGGTGSPAPVRARLLSLVTEACDMPAALHRADDPVTVAANGEHLVLERPHVLRYDDGSGVQDWMVLEVDGEIHLARRGPEGYVLSTSYGTPALRDPGEEWAADAVSDPVLRWTGTQLELWFTGWSGQVGTVARALFETESGRFEFDRAVLRPEDHPSVSSFDHAAPFDLGEALHVVVRERRGAGHRLALYALSEDGASFVQELVASREDLFAFDRDEVASPAVLFREGAYRLYYAGRRGTRWSIGLLVSHDGTLWRAPVDGALLRGDGEGFDAIGVRDPAPLIEPDGSLSLYFTGVDGARARIGHARQPAPGG